MSNYCLQRKFIGRFTVNHEYNNTTDNDVEIWFSLPLPSDSQKDITFIHLPEPAQKSEHPFLNTLNYYVVKPGERLKISYRYRGYEVSLVSGTRIRKDLISLSDEERHYFLRSTPINPVNGDLKNEANEIIKGEEDTVERARKLFTFILNNYRYSRRFNERGAMSFRKNKKGDCGEFAGLFVSYCRSLGISSRVMVGAWSTGKTQAHVWCEFFVENTGWIPVDISTAVLLKNPLSNFSIMPSSRVFAKKSNYFGAIEGKRICFSIDTDRALTPLYIEQDFPDNFQTVVVGDRALAWGYESMDGTALYMQPMYVKFHAQVKKLKKELVLGKWTVKESPIRQLFLTIKNSSLPLAILLMAGSYTLTYFLDEYPLINWINLVSAIFFLLYITISIFRKERNLYIYIMAVLFALAFLGSMSTLLE